MPKSKYITNQTLSGDLTDHPAINAWRRVDPMSADTLIVETIQEEEQRKVYRLFGIGPSNSNIIAKRSLQTEALRELAIYNKVLTRLPLPAIKLYGYFKEPESKFSWLFIEDVGSNEYSPESKEHRVLAGKWLGHMHTMAPDFIKSTEFMRERGPNFFRKHLAPAYTTIMENLANPMLSLDDLSVLREIVSQCKFIEIHWCEIEKFCDGMPQTIVHGDFKEDNIQICSRGNGNSLLVFDWNEAGWGIPALDLAKFLGYSVEPDINAYASIVQEHWSFMDIDTIYRLGYVGEIFRCVTSIRWQAEKLKYEWIEKPMSIMNVFKDWMNELIVATPWKYSAKLEERRRSFKRRTWH